MDTWSLPEWPEMGGAVDRGQDRLPLSLPLFGSFPGTQLSCPVLATLQKLCVPLYTRKWKAAGPCCMA